MIYQRFEAVAAVSELQDRFRIERKRGPRLSCEAVGMDREGVARSECVRAMFLRVVVRNRSRKRILNLFPSLVSVESARIGLKSL